MSCGSANGAAWISASARETSPRAGIELAQTAASRKTYRSNSDIEAAQCMETAASYTKTAPKQITQIMLGDWAAATSAISGLCIGQIISSAAARDQQTC